ncbi:hypothetical protein H4O21_00435 [Oceanospirillum sp. D5]|uniref:Uncharacterized protein n=1 Tax=Oceanospirillum sediminis TaxID=2760088 RepID=A0A839IK36_9GAMM|nr:hypothetical protein [Oceanospirillum sediminis]
MDSCLNQNVINNPQLRVEAQVHVVVNDDQATGIPDSAGTAV